MTRYIDADALFEKYQKWLEETPYTNQTDVQLGQRIVLCDIYHDLKYAPTIDAVEVVRCKDCKKAETEDCSHSYWDDDWGVFRIGYNGDDWYCADGERKSNVSEEEKEYLDKAFPEHDGGEWFDITDIMTKGETE